MSSQKKIYVIVGATASGKSAYALTLAKKINGEIIQPPFYKKLSTDNIVNKIFRVYKKADKI